jgi:ABC-type transport system substrate-binding protein
MFLRIPVFACFVAVAFAGGHVGPCKKHTLDFILLSGDALMAKIEDDVRKDLEKVGITVNTRLLEKDDFNTAMTSGDYNLCFTETWGPPYDPHTQVSSWFVPDEAHYSALTDEMKNSLEPKMTAVLKSESPKDRQEKWNVILKEIHGNVVTFPMWAKSMPAVINRRLSGYVVGVQQYDYDLHKITAAPGTSTSITVSPGSQCGIFGCKDPPNEPHGYRPNEFFINNWIFEGLVGYGQDGEILPALAASWVATDTSDGGQEWKFTLRSGVKFHDGSACDCAAIKMTFDHVLEPPLNTGDWHGWYKLPLALTSWKCDGEVFVAKLKEPYYPFLQELAFIRPIRVLSPNCYGDGPTSDKKTANSCPAGWDGDITELTCKGMASSCAGAAGAGTGPWKYVSKTVDGSGKVTEMKFAKNADWWGARGNIHEVVVKGHASSDDVVADLKNGNLDMVVGGGVLTPPQVQDFQFNHQADFQVMHGPPIMNTLIVMNAKKSPTDDVQLRKAIMHAIDKASIVETELGGASVVVDAVFPKDTPYCNVDLTPRWDYDFEKAQLLQCPPAPKEKIVEKDKIVEKTVTKNVPVPVPAPAPATSDDDKVDKGPILGLTLGLGIPFLIFVGVVMYVIGRKMGYEKFDKQKGTSTAGAQAVGNSGQIESTI